MSAARASLRRIAQAVQTDWDEGGTMFRGSELACVINRMPTENWQNGEVGKKNPDFLPRGFSVISVFRDALSEAPKAGEVFTDSGGQAHRIQEVIERDLKNLCLCKVSGTRTEAA